MSQGSMVLTGVVIKNQGNKGNLKPRNNSQWANKAELADNLALKLGVPRKRAMKILNAVLKSVGELLATKKKVAVKGFGTFESKIRKGRAYKHPVTGENVEVPDKETVVFKPSKNLLNTIKIFERLIIE